MKVFLFVIALMCLISVAFPIRVYAQTSVIDSGNVYFIGQEIPVPTSSTSVSFALEWDLIDGDSTAGEVYSGNARVSGGIAYIPTSNIIKKGIYFLAGTGISRRRIFLTDPLPQVSDPTTWPFGLITSSDKPEQGAAMAEEMYRVGIKFFHFDYPISTINSIGASSDPNAGRISAGFDSFITRAAQLGINPVFKLMNHYSQIAGPNDLNGNFYSGLQKIQTYYKGKQKYWTISNEPEGGGYSQFSPQQLAGTIKNMSIVLKGVDPNVKIIAGEFYGGCSTDTSTHCGLLISSAYRNYWDFLSSHNFVRINNGNQPVSNYLDAMNSVGISKPIWETEANGTMFGGPSEYSGYMFSGFPTYGDSDVHSSINKYMIRTFCLESLSGNLWVPARYNPNQPCLGADLFIAMHYNANWETMWALKRHWISNTVQPEEMNHKVADFRGATDMLYGSKGVTRIPNLEPTAECNTNSVGTTYDYCGADGYIYKHGPEYLVMLWRNTGDSGQDREVVITTNPADKIVGFDSFGNPYPLRNTNGQIKVWVRSEVFYIRGLSQLPVFTPELSNNNTPYFVTQPVIQAVAGKPYYYNAWAYDSDTGSGNNSMPLITYQLVNSPSGMTMARTDSTETRTALVSWPNPAQGVYQVIIRATSTQGAGQNVDQIFTLNVAAANTNLAPVIISNPLTVFARVGFIWRYNLRVFDPNGDLVTYSLPQKPTGMIVDSNGFIQWTPGQSGSFPVTVSVSDGQLATTQVFTLIVGTNDGQPLPSVTPVPVDLKALLTNWLQSTPSFDLIGDSKVNSMDFSKAVR